MNKTSVDQTSLVQLPQQIRDAARVMAVFEAEPFDHIIAPPGHKWAVAPAWMDPSEVALRSHWFSSVEIAVANWAAGVADQLRIDRSAASGE